MVGAAQGYSIAGEEGQHRNFVGARKEGDLAVVVVYVEIMAASGQEWLLEKSAPREKLAKLSELVKVDMTAGRSVHVRRPVVLHNAKVFNARHVLLVPARNGGYQFQIAVLATQGQLTLSIVIESQELRLLGLSLEQSGLLDIALVNLVHARQVEEAIRAAFPDRVARK